MIIKNRQKKVLGLSLALFTLPFMVSSVYCAEKNKSVSLETRVERLERRIGRLTDLMLQLEVLKRENSQLRGQLELQNHEFTALKRRQRDLYIDIDQRLSALQTASVKKPLPNTSNLAFPKKKSEEQLEPVITDKTVIMSPKTDSAITPAISEVSSDEENAYKKAFQLLTPSERRYPEAITALTAFLKKYPNSQLADNAQYWLAEANYVSQQNEAALAEFQKVIALYPNSTKVSGALLKIGYLQHSAGHIDLAKKALREVIKRFKGTAAANMADTRLKRIESESH